MGLTHTTVTVRGVGASKRARGYSATFLVDTGAVDCVAPAKALRKAGIREEGRAPYSLATGDIIELPYGFARVSFMGSETVTQIVFGSDDCEPLLGVVALENTGIGIDPVSKTLRRMTAKPLKKILRTVSR